MTLHDSLHQVNIEECLIKGTVTICFLKYAFYCSVGGFYEVNFKCCVYKSESQQIDKKNN